MLITLKSLKRPLEAFCLSLGDAVLTFVLDHSHIALPDYNKINLSRLGAR